MLSGLWVIGFLRRAAKTGNFMGLRKKLDWLLLGAVAGVVVQELGFFWAMAALRVQEVLFCPRRQLLVLHSEGV